MSSKQFSPRHKNIKAACAVSLESNLEELRRRSNLESLRPFIASEQCFPPQSDPSSNPITMEELKKLARAWKLHERRNFWKSHPDRDSMVNVLLQHIEDTSKLTGKSEALPSPRKPESSLGGGGYIPTPPPGGARPSSLKKISNYCGLKHFVREVNASEMVVNSRFYEPPEVETAIPVVVNRWRAEDFTMKIDDDKNMKRDASHVSSASLGDNTLELENLRRQVDAEISKAIKHRNLAAHLARFSTSIETNPSIKPATVNTAAVQTFVNIAETTDPQVATYTIIGLSNISSHPFVRSILVEINAVHKFTSLIPLLRGTQAQWATSLLFYYFSCESEIEDRIYNASISLLQTNGMQAGSSPTTLSAEGTIRTLKVTLDTLSNLLPCLDRIRVTELIMNIIYQHFMPNAPGSLGNSESIVLRNLQIILNATAFTNTHATLLGHDVLEILVASNTFAIKVKNTNISLLVAKILMVLLQLETSLTPVIADYICLVIDLIAVDDLAVLRHAVRIVSVLSSNLSLLDHVCDNDVISAITRIIENRPDLPTEICKDAARYLANICRPGISAEYMQRLMDELVPVSILKLMQTAKNDQHVLQIAVKGLQNILSYQRNCIELAKVCCLPLLKMMKEFHDVNAAAAMFNLSCVVECEQILSTERVHLKILSYLASANQAAKNSYLRILVQLSGSATCINEMLTNKLVPILSAEVSVASSADIWVDVSHLLLAVCVYRSNDLSKDDVVGTLQIVKRMCASSAQAASQDILLVQCTTILAFLSLQLGEDLPLYTEMDIIMRSILGTSIANMEQLFESCATVIYNITCNESAMMLLLKDGLYLNIMIKMMRSAKLQTQEVVAEAIRTLCSHSRCIELLLTMDLLSDLIVIALLRTSSDTIKEVCNDAFYNMLCNQDTRMKLLKGDLWWAIMRLSRSNNKPILWTCQRILYDLSSVPIASNTGHVSSSAHAQLVTGALLTASSKDTVTVVGSSSSSSSSSMRDDEVIAVLREHHVLTFVRDIACAKTTTTARTTSRKASQIKLDDTDIDFIEQCLRCANNFVCRYIGMRQQSNSNSSSSGSNNNNITKGAIASTSNQPFITHEVLSTISICNDILQLSKDVASMRIALLLLLRLSQDARKETVQECCSIDIDHVILHSHALWGHDQQCCLLVTRIFWELSKLADFTKAVDVVSVIDALCVAYNGGDPEGKGNPMGGHVDAGNAPEVISNVAGVLLQFIANGIVQTVNSTAPASYSAAAGVAAVASVIGSANHNPVINNNGSARVIRSILSSSLWGRLLCDCFGINRVESPKMTVASVEDEPHRRTIRMSDTNFNNSKALSLGSAISTHTKALVLSVLVHMVPEAVLHPKNIPCPVVRAILTLDHASNEVMKFNMKYLISQFSMVPELSEHLLDVGIFSVLHYMLRSAIAPQQYSTSAGKPITASTPTAAGSANSTGFGSAVAGAATGISVNPTSGAGNGTGAAMAASTNSGESIVPTTTSTNNTNNVADISDFVSSVLANISMHSSLLPKLVSSTDTSIIKVIDELLDVGIVGSCNNLSLFFYNACMNTELFTQAPLSPAFVMNTLFRVNKIFPDDLELVKLNKYIVGIVLNSYDLGSEVSPLYVQTIFSEMNSGNGLDPARNVTDFSKSMDSATPSLARGSNFIEIVSVNKPKNPQSLLFSKKSEPVALFMLPESESKWKRIIVRQPKIMERVIGHLANIDPVIVKDLEPVDAFPSTAFEKAEIKYDRIPLDSQVTRQFPSDQEYTAQVYAEYSISDSQIMNNSVSEIDHNSVSIVDSTPVRDVEKTKAHTILPQI